MKIAESKIPFNYKTIKVTQSRIEKGLLAIPVSLIDFFPKEKTTIFVSTEDSEKESIKNFTPYTSSSRECRIGGMRNFYNKYRVGDGDEIVIQFIDENRFRIFPEKHFEDIIKKLENQFDVSQSEEEAETKLNEVSKIVNLKMKDTALNEYFRFSHMGIEKRKYNKEKLSRSKEPVPAPLKKLLAEIYDGKCQISGFSFIMKSGKPYFEIHHIKSDLGNHVKNILVICPNIHAQFTYAFVQEYFDQDGWLRRVKFNSEEFNVNQMIDNVSKKFEKEIHFEF